MFSSNDETFAVRVDDRVNGDIEYFLYTNKEDAVKSVMISDFKTDKDESELKEYFDTDKNPSCIEQRDGQLYWQWMFRVYDDNRLVTSDGNNVPSTLDELQSYLESGHTITTCSQSRAPISYQVVKVVVPESYKNEIPKKSYGVRHSPNISQNLQSYYWFPTKAAALDHLMNNSLKITSDQKLIDQYLLKHEESDGQPRFVIEELNGKLYHHVGERTYQDNSILRDFFDGPFTSYQQFQKLMGEGWVFTLGEKQAEEDYQIITFGQGE